MPEHLRSFVVITVLMALAYAISRRLFAHALAPRFVDRLFAAGYGATAIMFFAHNMWLFLAGLAGLTFLMGRRLGQPLAIFVFLMLLMPGFTIKVPGFGLINYLIELNPQRILALVLLLPSAIHLAGRPGLPRPGKLLTDKIVIVYTLFIALLAYQQYATFTGALRQLFATTIDFVLLYFVGSRTLLSKLAVRHAIVSLVVAAIFLALVGVFEFAKRWLLYASVQQDLGADPGLFGYLVRGDTLRAMATTGQPIVLGFVMMVATLLTVYVQRLVSPGRARTLLWFIMGMGLVAAMSRGPWVGAAIGFAVIAAASANPAANLIKFVAAGLAAAFLLVLLPGGEKIINYLPWVGTIDAGGIDFRKILWEQAILVITKNPWLGSIDFNEALEFNLIRSGNGFVDIVNTYLVIALQYGILGLSLYVALLVSALLCLSRGFFHNKVLNTEVRIYGASLLATMLSMILVLWMVSNISFISIINTLLIAACVAYSQLYSRQQNFEYRV